MVNDRRLAVLLEHARTTGTKAVLAGAPKQLKAIGVGGSFAGIWRQADGPALTGNRGRTIRSSAAPCSCGVMNTATLQPPDWTGGRLAGSARAASAAGWRPRRCPGTAASHPAHHWP